MTQIIQNYLSDHQMITLSIHKTNKQTKKTKKKNERKRGPSYWKLNSSILVNKDYQNKISSFWQKWQKRKQNYKDPAIWWGNGKKFTQGLTKDF